jgi:hypothetical protein
MTTTTFTVTCRETGETKTLDTMKQAKQWAQHNADVHAVWNSIITFDCIKSKHTHLTLTIHAR